MMAEWALVVFTVLSQMAAGAFITLWALDTFTGKVEKELGTFATQGIVAAMGLALAASMGHLGHPLEAYRALANLGTSWLSREVALFGLFFVLAAAYHWRWKTGGPVSGLGAVGSVVALLALVSSGLVYTLSARPAWNNAGPVLFFLLTAASLGPLFIAVLGQVKRYTLGKNLFLAVTAALVCSLASLALYTTLLAGAGGVAAATGGNLVLSAAFWPRLLIGLIAPLGLLGYAATRQEWDIRRYIPVLFALVLLGELLGRELFYSSAVALTMFGL